MFTSVHQHWRAVAVLPAGPAAGASARCSVDACVSVASEAAAPDESTSAVLSCAGLTVQQTNPGKCAFPPLLPCLVEVCILCLCAGGAVMQWAWLCCHLPLPPHLRAPQILGFVPGSKVFEYAGQCQGSAVNTLASYGMLLSGFSRQTR